MKYPFPKIKTIRDVMPAIEGRGEFIVAEREWYTVVNYVVAMADTFEMTGPDDVLGAIRRECRGLIFNKRGDLVSRPFHKFFNVGERPETGLSSVNFEDAHQLLEKEDGSMIRPLVDPKGVLYLATKMGVTDIAEDAAKLLSRRQADFLRHDMVWRGLTPIFEYVSPTNKIVLNYEEPKLILLAVRNNLTGEYLNVPVPFFDKVVAHGSVETKPEDFVETIRKLEGREGVVIRFNDGHMIKVKADEYVRIHKVKDRIREDRHIADIIVHEEVDDLISILDEVDVKRIRDYETWFNAGVQRVVARLNHLMERAHALDGNKKRVALELVPNLAYKQDAKFIFGVLDGKVTDIRTSVLEYVKTQLGNGARYDAVVEWFGE